MVIDKNMERRRRADPKNRRRRRKQIIGGAARSAQGSIQESGVVTSSLQCLN